MVNRKNSDSKKKNTFYMLRQASGMEVAEIAEKVGCSTSLIYKIEGGSVIPKAELHDKLIEIYKPSLTSSVGDDHIDNDVDSVKGATAVIERFIIVMRKYSDLKNYQKYPIKESSNKNKITFEKSTELHSAIEELVSKELLSKNGEKHLTILWTGKNYDSYANVYKDIYRKYIIPICNSNDSDLTVSHILRGGISSSEKLDTLMYCAHRTIQIRNPRQYKIKIANNIIIQDYTQDIYFAKNVGAIFGFTGASFGEPSIGVLSVSRNDFYEEYLSLIESNSEEKVRYFPENERKEFYRQYLTTESRAGDCLLFQKMPANVTRPLADYRDNTAWFKRTVHIESIRNGLPIAEIIENRRTSTNIFLDRLEYNNFRHIMSRQAIERWVDTGEREDIGTGINYEKESYSEILSRIKNIINLMDRYGKNFSLAIADEKKLERYGFSSDNSKDISWVVQSSQATAFEGIEENKNKIFAAQKYHVVIKDKEFNDQMKVSFNRIWNSLLPSEVNQNDIRSFLMEKIRK